MKNKTTIIAALIIFNPALKPQLPNTNLENWVTINGYDSLIGWKSNNYAVWGPIKNIFKEGNNSSPGPYQGNYAAKISTTATGIVQGGSLGILVNGQPSIYFYPIIGMNPDFPYAEGGGTPINYKPTHLTGHYIFNSTDSIDKGVAYVILSKYNTVMKKRDTVAFATYYFAQNTAYTNFSIPITDLMPGVMPDTITTIFYSSNPNTVQAFVTSNLYIDALTLLPATGIEENDIFSNMVVYPNPYNCQLTLEIQSNLDTEEKIEIVDVNGKLVKTVEINPTDKKTEVSLEEVSSGTYFIKSNTQKGCKKIIKK